MVDIEETKAYALLKESAIAKGLDVFGEGAFVRRTSSRFCLSVEHGDYNGTELFGVGTDRFIWMAYKPNNTSGKFRMFSVNFPDEGVIELQSGHIPPPHKGEPNKWSQFAYGVDFELTKSGIKLNVGADIVVYGNIPGGGLSRSASLTLNLLLSILEVLLLHCSFSIRINKCCRLMD